MISKGVALKVIGISGNVVSVGLFLSPVPTFREIWRRRRVEQFSAAPYLAALLSCMFWCLYGLPKTRSYSIYVLSINGFGVLIEGIFLSIFLCFSKGAKRLQAFLALLAEIIIFGSLAAIVFTCLDPIARVKVVGILCAVFGTAMYISPLSVMKTVIQTKSVEYMPFYLSLVSFGNSLCWASYGFIKTDRYITISNALGLVSSIAQLIMHLLYYKSTKRQIEEREDMRRMGSTGIEISGKDINYDQSHAIATNGTKDTKSNGHMGA